MRPSRLSALVAVVLVLVSATAAEAQSAASELMRRFVLVVGVNRATFSGDDTQDLDPRTGLVIGAGMFFPFNANIGFQPELLYSMKGAVSEDAVTGDEIELKTNYLELPLLLRYNLPVAGTVRPFLLGGPSVGYQVGCDFKATSGGTTGTLSCDEFAELTGEPELEKVDFGFNLGGGVTFDMGGRALTLGLRFNQGLSRLMDDADGKHRVLSFVGSFELPVGRR